MGMGSDGGRQIGWSVLHGRISGIYLVISVNYRYMIFEMSTQFDSHELTEVMQSSSL